MGMTENSACVFPFAVALLSDAASDVNAQIFGVRRNEIVLFSQPRPIRSVHTAEGWTPQTVIERALPGLSGACVLVEKSPEVFSWAPI